MNTLHKKNDLGLSLNMVREISRCPVCGTTRFSMLSYTGDRNTTKFTCGVCGSENVIAVEKEDAKFPTIILNGKEVDNTKEMEIMNDDFGFNVSVEFKHDSNWDNETHLNCTEVHYLYHDFGGPKIAFESGIHGSGCTRETNEIERVIIITATRKHDHF